MLKRKYYCLVAGLPDLLFNDSKSGFASLTFRNELKEQLSSGDFNLVKQIFFAYDNKNLINLLFKQNKPFYKLGNISKEKLETQIIQPTEIPEYMIHFIKWIKIQESQKLSLQYENKLHQLFYEQILQLKNEFLCNWYTFQLNLKNILTAINCKQFNYDIKSQIIQVDEYNSINTLLLNYRLKHDFYEDDIPYAEQIFRIAESDTNLIEKEKSVDKIKWNYLDEQTFFHYFSIEKILSFVLKLIITERWMKLDAKTGRDLLDKLINDLETSYEFPPEFSTAK